MVIKTVVKLLNDGRWLAKIYLDFETTVECTFKTRKEATDYVAKICYNEEPNVYAN